MHSIVLILLADRKVMHNLIVIYTSDVVYQFRFEGRRELPFPPRFERGPPGPPEGPMDNVRAAAGPLPAPPVAWSRGSEDWKDPWLRSVVLSVVSPED